MSSLYVIYALGRDKPGLVHSVSGALASLGINIVDVEARSVRGHFLLFLVVDLSPSPGGYNAMVKSLEPLRSDFDLGLRIEPCEEGLRNPDKHLLVATLMGVDRPGIVASISGMFSENGVNIESIKMIARGDYIAMELTVDASNLDDVSGLRRLLYRYSESTGLDVSLQEGAIFTRPKRVVIFDCDSTIIQEEVIDELARAAGVGRAVEDMTARAMNGELDFKDALR